MHIHLRERNVDVFPGEGFVYFFVHVKVDTPEVGGFYPSADNDVYGAFAERGEGDEVCGVFHDAWVAIQQAGNYFPGFVVAVAIGDAEFPVNAAVFFFGVVFHDTCRQSTVRDDDDFVVGSCHDGVEDLYFAHCAALALCLDEVAHFEGFEEQDHHTAGEVLQRTAQCHTDGNTGRSKKGDEGTGFNTQNTNNNNDEQEVECDVQQAFGE